MEVGNLSLPLLTNQQREGL